jgi:type II restriction enzyme
MQNWNVAKKKCKINELKIKGLGPAVASILYFLHPTWFHHSTRQFQRIFYSKTKKLGSWTEYLKKYETLIETNSNINLNTTI